MDSIMAAEQSVKPNLKRPHGDDVCENSAKLVQSLGSAVIQESKSSSEPLCKWSIDGKEYWINEAEQFSKKYFNISWTSLRHRCNAHGFKVKAMKNVKSGKSFSLIHKLFTNNNKTDWSRIKYKKSKYTQKELDVIVENATENATFSLKVENENLKVENEQLRARLNEPSDSERKIDTGVRCQNFTLTTDIKNNYDSEDDEEPGAPIVSDNLNDFEFPSLPSSQDFSDGIENSEPSHNCPFRRGFVSIVPDETN